MTPNAEYIPPVLYSGRNRAKLVFMIEARATVPTAEPKLHPGQPVEVRIKGESHSNS